MEITSGNIVINSLPVFQIKKGEEMAVNVECAICLGEFEEGEWIKLLPNCTHGFHVSCIDTWFRSHSNCPLCRSCVAHYTDSCEREESEEFSTGTDAHFQSVPSEISPNLEIVHHHCPH
uniref:RING-type E3 ubiquitin transferase n=2 Tax=Cajanus cajan TaxID=3821 RepID=A0A151SUU4_CAJCA|nr:RING-H2 finger protein ATL1O [Cajanus cajan]